MEDKLLDVKIIIIPFRCNYLPNSETWKALIHILSSYIIIIFWYYPILSCIILVLFLCYFYILQKWLDLKKPVLKQIKG